MSRRQWRLFALIVGGVTSMAGLMSTGASAASDPEAVAAVAAVLPSMSQLFVNCPPENKVPQADGSTAIECEYRGVARTAVRTGNALATFTDGEWTASHFSVALPVPRRWHSCKRHGFGLGLNPTQDPRALRAHGVSCDDARFLASDIGARVSRRTLRLRHRFTEARYGTNTIGFVIHTFACIGIVRIRRGTTRPYYGHETARCRNRFGDGFVYTFDQQFWVKL